MQPLVSLGAQRVLEQADIWPLCLQDTCNSLAIRFEAQYPLAKTNAPRSIPIVAWALLRTFRGAFVTQTANYVLHLTTMVLQPFVAQAMLDYLNHRDNVFGISNGYALVALMAVVSFISITTVNFAGFTGTKAGANARSIVMNVVFQKALRLSSAARQSYTTGEITTLMSVDAERVSACFVVGMWAFIAPVSFVVTVVLIGILYSWVAAIVGATLLVAVIVASLRMAKHMGQLQAQLLSKAEERVRMTSESLQGIRVMKYYAWEDAMAQRIESIRVVEVQLYRKFQFWNMLNSTLLFLTPLLFGGVVLAICVAIKGSLSVTQVFTLIAVVNISRLGVSLFPNAVAAISQARVACIRLDRYLASEELSASVITDDTQQVLDHSKTGEISIRNATFSWGRDGEPSHPADSRVHNNVVESEVEAAPSSPEFQLVNVDLHVKPGSLVVIVGAVGAGKSSLLSAMLGEMHQLDGERSLGGDVSYVGQEAWIRNATVEKNILFEEELEPERYAQVLECTQLAQDLAVLPNGDQTEIGERGINLSGGQKARISMARAVYRSHYDILVMDDPLSAVDAHVAHAMFDQCINGMARNKTRLLVLNGHYDLLPHADQIVVMRAGKIVANGPFDKVVARFPDLKYSRQETAAPQPQPNAIESEEIAGSSHTPTTGAVEATSEDEKAGYESADSVDMAIEQESLGDGKLVEIEDPVVSVVALAYAIGQSVRVLADWWQGYWAQNMARDGSSSTHSNVWFGLWFLGWIVLCCIVTFGRGLLLMEVCIRISTNLHNELLRRVLQAPVNRYFDVTPVGRIINRFSNDLDQVDATLPQQYHNLLQSLAVFMGCLAVCGLASYWIVLTYVPMFFVFIGTGWYFKKSSREIKRLDGITRTPIFNLFGETLTGLSTIRAFRMQSAFARLNKQAIDANGAIYWTYTCAARWLAIRLDWLSVCIITFVSLFVVVSRDHLSPLIAGISITYSLMLTTMVQWVVRAFDMTDNAMTSVERLLHFRTIPAEIDEEDSVSVAGKSWPRAGAIHFDNRQLRYRPELPLALRGVSMTVAGGEKLGICGRTGAGKSSLIVALFRICEIDRASIFALAIIPQDPVLYSGTLRENLDPFHEHDDDAIWSVLRHVHLADAVTTWSSCGLDFAVSEKGGNLSVGQRQLLCIGRALLKKSRVVVLDEATANVDSVTDALIQHTIQHEFQGKTVLIIAHRINTIMHCDKIAVMDAGRVAEFGSPQELLGRSDSIFASLQKRSQQS
ncbi:TPA: hypothetical protein N0F65_002122 [Lagenidium giganteum]|uniref:ABC transporter n=1 Tax=Lagenidium giganteum TaxID=4803 RepID=A0AAV2ZEI1_9STRA|nr:TPA: hypothetical protein N0F65_002122 [Lagenidium giganteum]